MPLDSRCAKCSGEMQAGLVVDLNYAGIPQSMWVEESAVKSVGAATAKSKRQVKTVTYRCANCGYLDSYAE